MSKILNVFSIFTLNKWRWITTNPRTGICCSLAALMTSSNLSMLSSIEQLIFFLLNVSDADPNTATSVAPAATLRKDNFTFELCVGSQAQIRLFIDGLFIRIRSSTNSIFEALKVGCQNWVLNTRCFLNSSEYVSIVCHLYEWVKLRVQRTSNLWHHSFRDGQLTKSREFQYFFSRLEKRKLLPAVPTLKRRNWWLQSLAALIRTACLSAGFSPLSEQFPGEWWNQNNWLWVHSRAEVQPSRHCSRSSNCQSH